MKHTKSFLMALLMATATLTPQDTMAQTASPITKHNITLSSDLMTPEALWSFGRIGGYQLSPDGKQIVYQVGYYSVEQNKGHQVLYIMNSDGSAQRQLTSDAKSEMDAQWICGGTRIAFMRDGQIWTMASDGSDRKQLTNDAEGFDGFSFSPDGTKVMVIKQIPYHESIQENPSDLPLASGRLVTDLNYRHWDEYVETIPHVFIADVNSDGTVSTKLTDILDGEPYECPLKPFSGMEQLAWSPDSKSIAYTCRKKSGVQYAISTDSDIYLYDVATGQTRNLCKPAGYVAPEVDATKTMKQQSVNNEENLQNNPGYDQNPRFSPDGRYVAWLSMARDGYESDRQRICVLDLVSGEKKYITERFDSNADDFCWAPDSKTLYFIGVWHATENIYRTDLSGNVVLVDAGQYDYGSLQMMGKGQLLCERHSISQASELYVVTPGKQKGKANSKAHASLLTAKASVAQITTENKHLYDQLSFGDVEERWCKTTDNQEMLYWIIKPAHFDPSKKYPTLLFCEGGPQSPVSQFWSYRWNFQIMAANGYVIVAPNRRGLPGFGSQWCEEISGDWTGQCMQDYLSCIDDAAANLPYVDKDRLGAVGASFGGFSVYYLAGHHDGRFKCFISHDGAFNLESMYTDTEEAWFSNWEYEDAYWNKDLTANARRTYENSPHRFVDKWDTPILCIHGEKDYRINYNQGMGAFNAARMRGIPAELLIFPDENHWVLKPQNGILWQRTFFGWLDKWLK